MIKEQLENLIKNALKEATQEKHWAIPKDFDIPITISPHKNFGDYSSTLPLILSKIAKDSPMNIAQLLLTKITKDKYQFVEKIEIASPGYLNFFLQKNAFPQEILVLKNIVSSLKTFHPRPIIVEYSSPNIAKPMHIGHLRSTIIGETLAKLYETLGYHVIRWNYLGDWGTQFGKLIVAYKLWGKQQEIQKNPIDNLLKLYQKFHQELKQKPELEKLAQEEFKKLEAGDKTNKRLWLWFKKESLKEFLKIYNLLGIKFDILKGESDFEPDLLPLIEELKKKKLIQESQGALILPLDEFNLPPALIQKTDKASLYFTRDLANLIYRIKKYHPEKILYVVGNEQSLYFKQLFSAAQILNLDPLTQLEHIKFGLILDAHNKKFSTREGELITLKEVIDTGLKNSLAIIRDKHPQWPLKKQKQLAQIIALGALKFNDLKSFRTQNIIFDWQQMLSFKGNSSVYLQYTYARINKIISRAKIIQKPKIELLNKELEKNIIQNLLEFKDIVQKSAHDYAPHLLANYLLSLADLLNNYYEEVPVLKELNINRRAAQIVFLKTAATILKQGMEILGITPLKEI
ncbi:MAG: arginine--tRNA ligase [Parcubacteria group bacterium]|nr:arginine--tRNA ligase [Parcubacteria group bacterium]